MQLDYDAAIAWIDERAGRRMFAASQGLAQEPGNTRLSVVGELRRAEGEIMLMQPAPGRVDAFQVGDATLVLLEGEFAKATMLDFGSGRPEMVQAEFRDMIVIVGEAPE